MDSRHMQAIDTLDAERSDESFVVPVSLTVNGQPLELELEPWTTVLDLLREGLHLSGTKKGCDHGQCGACTVLIDGKRANACLALAVLHDGASIVTIEGLARVDESTPAASPELHPVQQAFIDHDAFQCGYCTPGQICSAIGMLTEGHVHTRDDIREQMSGNVCRCGCYTHIVDAIADVAHIESPPVVSGERSELDRDDDEEGAQ